MISTICNEVIYPYTNFRAANLGDDIVCIDLPSFITKTVNKTTSLYQLKRVANLFFSDVKKDSGVNLAVAINRSLGEVFSEHRLLINNKNDEIRPYLKRTNPHAVDYNRILDCHQNESHDPEYMTKLAIDLVKNTNTFVLLVNPNRIICHRSLLHSLSKFLCKSPFNYVDEDVVAIRVFSAIFRKKSTEASIFKFADVLTSIKKAIQYRKRDITYINEFDAEATWENGASLITNSKMIIFKLNVDNETVIVHFDTRNMKAVCIGMAANFQVKELMREYRDYVRYNKAYFDIFE